MINSEVDDAGFLASFRSQEEMKRGVLMHAHATVRCGVSGLLDVRLLHKL